MLPDKDILCMFEEWLMDTSSACFENQTKTSCTCNTFCESIRLHDVDVVKGDVPSSFPDVLVTSPSKTSPRRVDSQKVLHMQDVFVWFSKHKMCPSTILQTYTRCLCLTTCIPQTLVFFGFRTVLMNARSGSSVTSENLKQGVSYCGDICYRCFTCLQDNSNTSAVICKLNKYIIHTCIHVTKLSM